MKGQAATQPGEGLRQLLSALSGQDLRALAGAHGARPWRQCTCHRCSSQHSAERPSENVTRHTGLTPCG